MDLNDFKVYALSSAGFMITFSAVEDILKITLLIVSIIYTVFKIMETQENKSKNKNDKN
jgi:hypothetical protein